MFARRNQLQTHRESQHPGHAGPFYVVEDVNSVQVEDIIIPVEGVEDGVEISVGVDSVNIMEGVALAWSATTYSYSSVNSNTYFSNWL